MQHGQRSIAADPGSDGLARRRQTDHDAGLCWRRHGAPLSTPSSSAYRVPIVMSQLPFLPFSKPTIDEATIAAVGEVLRSGWITSGPKVQAFEAQLSEYFGGRPVRTFNSGTCTMEIALRIAGIGPGDEVITTPISWVATANVILEVGATPVFADIDPVTRNIDLAQVEAAITPRTKAIIPVYLAGLPVDMSRLYALAQRHGLRVVEDAAQALGSSWNGQRIGATGDFVSFSFQANKNVTCAEGGCLVLNNAEEVRLAEKYRLQGVTRNGFDGLDVDVLGGKFNMTDVAAAIGLGQFAHIHALTAHRRALARHYFECFGSDFEARYGAQLPPADFTQSNWHLFQLVLPERGDGKPARATFMEQMQERGIGIGYHYPPIHLLSLYRERGFKEGMFSVAERVGRLIVSLPMFSSMSLSDVERSVAAVKEVLAR
jgi:dTDP-4-amino-4,6-dideoxygalactose transaminase